MNPESWTDDQWIAAMEQTSAAERRPERPKIQLHFRINTKLLNFTPWQTIQNKLDRELRGREEFYEYVDDPAAQPVSWSYTIQGIDGFTRTYRPGDISRLSDIYIVATAEFQIS